MSLISSQVYSQTLSHTMCSHYEGLMKSTVLSWRSSGIPVGEAQKIFNNEEHVETRVFLKKITRETYANPDAGRKFLESGQFREACLKVHRGF